VLFRSVCAVLCEGTKDVDDMMIDDDAELNYSSRSQRSSLPDDPEREPQPKESPTRACLSDLKAELDGEPWESSQQVHIPDLAQLPCEAEAEVTDVAEQEDENQPAVGQLPPTLPTLEEEAASGGKTEFSNSEFQVDIDTPPAVALPTPTLEEVAAVRSEGKDVDKAMIHDLEDDACGIGEGSELISPVNGSVSMTGTSFVEEEGDVYIDGEETFSPAALSSSSKSSPSGDESPFDPSCHPRPGQEGMPRQQTLLQMFEDCELRRETRIIVPEGLGKNRKVTFVFENTRLEVALPEGYQVGQEVPILVPKRPPLEKNVAQAHCRGHPGFPDKHTIMEPLRHSSRADKTCKLGDPEFVQRYEMYKHLRGKSMHPLLPFTPEEDLASKSPDATP